MLKTLASQAVIYGLSTIIVKFINYMLTPYLTNILPKFEYGVQGYFYGLIPFGLTLLTMGLETGYFRFYGKCTTTDQRNTLFSTLLTAITVTALVFVSSVIIFTPEIFSLIDSIGENNLNVIPLVGSLIGVDAILAIAYTKLRAENRAKKFMLTRLIHVIINVFFCVFFYSILPGIKESPLFSWMWIEGFNAGYIFISNLIASSIILLMVTSDIRFSRPVFDPKVFKLVFLFSLPLLISGIGGTANEFIDRVLLEKLLPDATKMEDIGIYTAVMKIATLVYLFTQIYKFAAEPFFLSNVKKKDFKEANAKSMKFFIIISLSIFLFINLYMGLFKYIVGEEYRVGLSIAPILLLSNVLIGVYFNLSFWYKITEKTFFAIIITLIGLCVTVIFNFVMIPHWGYTGSAWARLACEATMVALSYYLNQKYYPIPYDLKAIGKYALLAAIIFTISSLVKTENWVEYLINTVLFSTFIFYFLRTEKINIIKEIKSLIRNK